MKRLLGFAMPIFVAATLAAACGTSETPADSQPGASTGPVSVTDGRGKEIKLNSPAKKVVGLEWGEVEMLISLGVMPVGVADVKGYSTWVTAEKLDASVKDVGTRNEPSVDSVVALQPDLVVMEGDNPALVEQLVKIVPVLVAKGSDASRNLDRMREDFKMIATAVGKTREATKILGEFDAALAAGKQKVAAAGKASKPFAIADGWKDGSKISIRMFGQGALVSQLGIQLGLKNAWTAETDKAWGLGATDVEGLAVLKDTDLHWFYNASDGLDVFADGLAGNAIWDSMTVVKNKQLHKMPNGIWTFGGPASCKQYLDELLKVYGS